MNDDGAAAKGPRHGPQVPAADDLVRPSRVQALIRAHGLTPNRRLGQHFLIDGNIRQHILDAAELGPGDRVLEVGAGLGTLTLPIAALVEHVVAVEIDRGLCTLLERAVAGRANITLVQGDAVRFDPAPYFATAERAKVVANLPYQITGPLLVGLLERGAAGRPRWERLVVMVQEELARRLAAHPGNRQYGRFSVMVQYFARAELLRTVPPAAFLPPPGVTSALVRLWPRADVAGDVEAFSAVVRAAFAQRRKTLANALAGAEQLAVDKAASRLILAAAEIEPGRRAETLTVREYTALADALAAYQRLSDPSC